MRQGTLCRIVCDASIQTTITALENIDNPIHCIIYMDFLEQFHLILISRFTAPFEIKSLSANDRFGSEADIRERPLSARGQQNGINSDPLSPVSV